MVQLHLPPPVNGAHSISNHIACRERRTQRKGARFSNSNVLHYYIATAAIWKKNGCHPMRRGAAVKSSVVNDDEYSAQIGRAG